MICAAPEKAMVFPAVSEGRFQYRTRLKSPVSTMAARAPAPRAAVTPSERAWMAASAGEIRGSTTVQMLGTSLQ